MRKKLPHNLKTSTTTKRTPKMSSCNNPATIYLQPNKKRKRAVKNKRKRTAYQSAQVRAVYLKKLLSYHR